MKRHTCGDDTRVLFILHTGLWVRPRTRHSLCPPYLRDDVDAEPGQGSAAGTRARVFVIVERTSIRRHSGRREAAIRNLEIPGLVLAHNPGMTESVATKV